VRTIRTQNAWVRETPAGLGIELHWHLIDAGYYVQRVPIAWFWDHSMEVPLGARRVRVFSPEAQLLHLAAHIELHHAGAGVWWVYDVAALLHKFGGALDWDLIIDAAERFEWGRSLRVAVARADDVRRVRSGGGDRASRGDACHLARARGADFGGTIGPSCRVSVRQLGAGSWRARGRYLWRSLFPPVGFMRGRSPIRNRRDLLWQYLLRLGRGLYRVPRALWAGVAQMRRAG
jgi:hypothetical protein